MALARKALLLSRRLDSFGGAIAFAHYSTKHYNPKFKWHRGKKYIDVGIDFNKKETDEDRKRTLRELGMFPIRRSLEVPIYVDSSVQIFDPYVPEPGDGQYTSLTKRVTSALNIKDTTVKKGKNLIALRKIRKFIANFDEDQFAQKALDIYIKAHTALASNDMNELEKYATTNAICLMHTNRKNKTIRWKYIESLDPPKTVHLRTSAVGTEENVFAQVTVRFHAKQMLAIYDRFGRLMYGSEILAKDVLEFGVFEIHLTNLNGTFKLHDKIIPEGAEPKYAVERTCQKPKEEEEEEEEGFGEEYKLISDGDEQEEKKEVQR